MTLLSDVEKTRDTADTALDEFIFLCGDEPHVNRQLLYGAVNALTMKRKN